MTQSELTLSPPRQERASHTVERREAEAWRERAILALTELAGKHQNSWWSSEPKLRKFTADQWREQCGTEGVGNPHHPSQWGIAAREARKRGIIRDTGEWVRSKRPEANSRMIPVWEAGQ